MINTENLQYVFIAIVIGIIIYDSLKMNNEYNEELQKNNKVKTCDKITNLSPNNYSSYNPYKPTFQNLHPSQISLI